MECLTNLIGLETDGTSGLALIALPGISIDNFEALKNKVDETNASVWEKIQKRTSRKFATACMSRLNECFKINDPVIIECLICEKVTLFATAYWYLLGVETMVERMYSDRVNRFTTIDRPEAMDLQGYYQNEYEKEILLAINGLNPNESDCLVTPAECSSSGIRFVETSL